MGAKLGHIVTEETREKLRLSHLGMKHSPETIMRMKLAKNSGWYGKNEKHPLWKEGKIDSRTLHAWVHRNKKEPRICVSCGSDKDVDAANISQKYLRDVNDFEWLCRKCHMTKDGRLFHPWDKDKHKLKLLIKATGTQKARFECIKCRQPFAYYKPLTTAQKATRYVNKQLLDAFPCSLWIK